MLTTGTGTLQKIFYNRSLTVIITGLGQEQTYLKTRFGVFTTDFS